VIVSFSLDDLKHSIPGAADLATLTGDDLSAALQRILGKAADGAVVRIDGKMINLDFGDIPPDQLQEADRLCEKASRQANKGELPKAASIYRRALELNPSLQIARRALAMALLESGKSDEAIDVLLDALKTDPRDHEALVILGNHYARQDEQHDVALSLIRRACEVAPEDPVAHNSLGALLLEKDQAEEAVKEFDAALAQDPTMANAWYGRSVAEIGLQRWKPARDSLQQMFALGQLTDRRLGKMLREARDSFRRVSNIIGNDRAAESLKAAENLAATLGSETGFPVTVREIPLEPQVFSRSKPAWTTGGDHHLIELNEKIPAEMVKHHLVSHECSLLLLAARARATGKHRIFITTSASLARAGEALRSEIQRIAHKGYDAAKLTQVVLGVTEARLNLLFQVPLDILVEKRLSEVPELQEAQFCSLLLSVHDVTHAGLNSPNRELMPGKVLVLRDTLNAVAALFLDRISSGATDYSALYTKSGVLPRARKIEALAYAHDGPPGSEYDIIDQIADLLGVRDWYEWENETGLNPPETNPS
jgi:tetratricopeptide (TPR) repeat protein